MTRFPAVGGGSGNEFMQEDAAETFGESDVAIDTVGAGVSNGSVEMAPKLGSRFSTGTDAAGNSGINSCGLVVNPNKTLEGLRVNSTDSAAAEADRFVIRRPDGTRILEEPYNGLPQTYKPSNNMEPGVDYDCFWEDDSGDMTGRSLENETGSLEDFDVIGVVGQQGDITDMEAVITPKSSTVTVEWPTPDDIYRWDAATFQTTPDGETVEVYIEESTDGGSTWTTIAGPINRGESITADPASQMRFRVELSRTDSANNPQIDALYRRWVV